MIPICGSNDNQYVTLIGSSIGDGTTRNVYKVIGDENKVIKVGKISNCSKPYDANKREANFFYEARKVNATKTLNCIGKIFSISESGKYLIMEYLSDIDTDTVEYIFPVEVDDRSNLENYGTDTSVTAKVKMRDYALLRCDTVSDNTGSFTISPESTSEMDKFKSIFKNL